MNDEKMNEEIELVVRIKNIREDSAGIPIVKDMKIDLSPEQAQSLKMISTLKKQSQDHSQTESSGDEDCCNTDVEPDGIAPDESVAESHTEEDELPKDTSDETSCPKKMRALK